MGENMTDYELANNLAAQGDLLRHAFATGDDAVVEQALLRVTHVRRMVKNGTLEWENPGQGF